MLVTLTLVLATLLSTSMSFTVTDFLKDAILGTWDNAPPNGATLFFCSDGSRMFFKDLFSMSSTLRLAQPYQWEDALDSTPSAAPFKIHTIIVDWQCPKIEQLMQKASNLTLMKSPYRWLILNVTNEEQTEESCEDLADDMSAKGTALADGKAADADVVLVCRGTDSLILVDFWGHEKPTVLGKWVPSDEPRFQSDRNPPAVRRLAVGLNGHVFRTAFVIANNDSYNHLTDGVNKKNDYLTKFNYEVTFIVADMLKASILPIFTQHWGYLVNGTWNGLVGLQFRGEAEVGGTPSTLSHDRLKVQTFLNYLTPATACFIFREPPMSYVYNVFIRPFPPSLWLASIGILVLGALLLYMIFYLAETGVIDPDGGPQMVERGAPLFHATWSDMVLLNFGAVCQQGSEIEARGVSGRIVTIFIYLGILFLHTSYTASIVALLQSTTSDIHHFKDFLDSPIELAAANVSYNRYYLGTNNDTLRRRIYVEKMTKHGKRDGFMSMEEGLKRVLKSYFAFFSIRADMYQAISDTFQEHEKCGLREIDNNFLGVRNPIMTVSKWSTHAEVFRIALRKIQERGIRQRQLQKYLAFKPGCVNQGGNFQSVSLTDCYGAFVTLISSYFLSFFILSMEIFAHHRTKHLKM